jgi:hypothetical protein
VLNGGAGSHILGEESRVAEPPTQVVESSHGTPVEVSSTEEGSAVVLSSPTNESSRELKPEREASFI